MNKKVGLIIGIMIAIALISYGAFQLTRKDKEVVGDLTITHELGETVVSKNPERVIVFDFGVLDTFDTLGIEVIGLPRSSAVPSYLSQYNTDQYENVGSLQEPLFEKIYELNPDLIIISGRQRTLYEQFTDIAPTIYLGIDNTKYLESFKANMETIGKIFDKETEIETELNKIDQKVEALHELASASDLKGLVLLLNSSNISAYGVGSRFGIIHDEFGVQAVDENIEVSTHGQNVNFEYIRQQNPDLIFVVDRGTVVSGGTPADGLLDNEIVNGTNAAINDEIHYLDAEIWYLSVGGLGSTNKMIDEINEVFN